MNDSTTTLALAYIPPLDWRFFLRYLGARATPGVEAVIEPGRYVRTIEVGGDCGRLALSHHPEEDRLLLEIQGEVTRHTPTVLARVRLMFDLDVNLALVHETLRSDPGLGPLLSAAPGIRVPGAWCPFELLVRTIVGQQVTVKAATTIIGRIASRLGTPVDGANPGEPSFLFPSPRAIADGSLASIGMPSKRAEALQNVARAIADKAIPFPSIDLPGNPDEIRQALLERPGIGPWTVEYFALRALRDPDAWPATDLILRRAVAQLHQATSPAIERWKPYRGYAAMHLWNNAAQDSRR